MTDNLSHDRTIHKFLTSLSFFFLLSSRFLKQKNSDPPTENDCCSLLVVNSDECIANGTWGGKDVYSCASNPLKMIFHFAGNWFLGFDGLPQGYTE